MVGIHNRGLNPNIAQGAVVPNYNSGYHSWNNEEFTGRNGAGQVTVDAVQRNIVMTINPLHNDDNHRGSTEEIEAALEYVGTNATSESVESTTMNDAVITLLNNELANGRWVVACLVSAGASSGHAIVIRSYNETSDYYTYWDPWTCDVGTFSEAEMRTDQIRLSGTTTYELFSFQCCS